MSNDHHFVTPSPHRPAPDLWQSLRRWTPARIALGRAGGSLPTRALLDFRLAHARAIDAVYRPFDPDEFARTLTSIARVNQLGTLLVTTAVTNANAHLQRPDWGRQLSDESRKRLEKLATTSPRCDLVIIVADGLS